MREVVVFLVVAALLTLGAAGQAAVAAAAEEEARAARAFFEQTDRAQLVSLLAACELDASPEEAQCRRARYTQRVIDELSKLRTAPVEQGARTADVVSTSETSYQALFENFVLQGIPFKGMLVSNISDDNAVVSHALSECGQQAAGLSEKDRNAGLPLRDCVNADTLLSTVQVPVAALNSYNIRLRGAEGLGVGGEDLAMHWPSVLPISSSYDLSLDRASPIYCPSGMHMLLWSPSATLYARLFPRGTASHELSPKAGEERPHRLQFQAPEASTIGHLGATETVLRTGEEEYLFVPRSHLVSLAVLEDHTGPASVLQMCYFDASNLNFVRESLAVAAFTLEPQARGILAALHATGFDFNMTRKAPLGSMSVKEHAIYPRSQQQEDGTAGTATPRRGRDRSKGGAGAFRDWQDAAKWSTMVMSLTLPQPLPPQILLTGRTNITVTWCSEYFPSSQLQQLKDASAASSPAGFNLTVCEAEALGNIMQSGLLEGASSQEDGSVQGCQVLSISSRELLSLSQSTTRPSDELVIFRTTVLGLQPAKSYITRLSIYYEGAGGMPSLWSESAVTQSLSPPAAVREALQVGSVPGDPTSVRLVFARPIDDGGSEILGFHIFACHTERYHHYTEWAWHFAARGRVLAGNEIEIDVPHLLPKATYKFQVSSFNMLGNSSLSSISASVMMNTPDGGSALRPEIFGGFHERRFSGVETPVIVDSMVRHWVTVDDDAQTLKVIRKGLPVSEFEVWDCHWSPRVFKVTAEVMWSSPPLSDRLTSDDMSRHVGKIVVTRRGRVPIVVKAQNLQRSGAIAVLVVDDERELCTAFNQRCMAGADKSKGERFAVHDHSKAWESVRIPVLLIKAGDTDSFLEASGLLTFNELSKQRDSLTQSEL